MPRGISEIMISFTVTAAAKAQISAMKQVAETKDHYRSLVPAILWGNDGSRHGFEWMIGFYERDRIALEWIIALDAIEFYVDPTHLLKLKGKKLDYLEGKFQIIE